MGILRRSIPSRHVIQNKFAHLHGRIVEVKERNKRAYNYESALNFTGSISPVRIPDFEADLNQLSKISSPIEMEELSRKYEGSVDSITLTRPMITSPNLGNNEFNPFDNDETMDNIDLSTLNSNSNTTTIKVNNTPITANIPKTPSKSPKKQQTDENNFPTVISPLKRPRKEIEAESKKIYS